MKDDIKLPPLPDNDAIERVVYARTRTFIPLYDAIRHMMQEYSIDAIKADRQQRGGEPVECFKCGHAKHGGECVNVAPQHAAPAPEPVNVPSDEDLLDMWYEIAGSGKSDEALEFAYALLDRYGRNWQTQC